jgi:phosphorylcholine metabolism protein LicD
MPGAYNYISFEDEDEDAVAQTTQSIAESESSHNSKFVPKEDLYKQSLQQNNKLSFKDDEFQTMNNLDNSMTQHHFIGLSADNMFIPQAAM